MIIYRPHRGSLAEAMAEAKEFKTARAMKHYIVKTWSSRANNLFYCRNLSIDKESRINDERTGWEDTCYVLTNKLYGKKYTIPQCIGMCATIYPKLSAAK